MLIANFQYHFRTGEIGISSSSEKVQLMICDNGKIWDLFEQNICSVRVKCWISEKYVANIGDQNSKLCSSTDDYRNLRFNPEDVGSNVSPKRWAQDHNTTRQEIITNWESAQRMIPAYVSVDYIPPAKDVLSRQWPWLRPSVRVVKKQQVILFGVGGWNSVKISHGSSYVEIETRFIVLLASTQLYYCATRGRNSLKTNEGSLRSPGHCISADTNRPTPSSAVNSHPSLGRTRFKPWPDTHSNLTIIKFNRTKRSI